MAKKKIGVAIIGSGSIATYRHAPEYAAHPNVEIIAFVDPVIERAEKLAKKYDAKAFRSHEEVLQLKDVDAVSVCTPNVYHAPITIEASRPVNMFCAKNRWRPPIKRLAR